MYGTDFYTYELTGGWSYEGRNRALFPDRGMKITLSARYALPLSEVRYYQTNFDFITYIPLWQQVCCCRRKRRWTMRPRSAKRPPCRLI